MVCAEAVSYGTFSCLLRVPTASIPARMSDAFNLADRPSFVAAMKTTKLPGTENQALLKTIYELAAHCVYLQTTAQQKVTDTAAKYQPNIKKGRSVQRLLNRARKDLIAARNIYGEQFPYPWMCETLFRPAEQSLEELSESIQKSQQMALVHVHPHFLEKGEVLGFVPLLEEPEHQVYPLGRLGNL